MRRFAIEKLVSWKDSDGRKPLIIYGARQVGKTWLVREFAKSHFKNIIDIDFNKNPEFSKLFVQDLDPFRIIKALEVYFSRKIDPNDTLIFFDEIQECPSALNSLKYFEDSAKEYHVISAGSYLGLGSTGRFPVGKVESITLFPMSFYEYLDAIGQELLLEAIEKLDFELLAVLSSQLIEHLKTYLFVGGMPEAVSVYSRTKDLVKTRKVQNELLINYDYDFGKHIPTNIVPKVEMIWNSIPNMLAKEKKKFVYKEIKLGGRASQFEDALMFLEDTRLVYKVLKITKARLPLSRYPEKDIFKLYMLDVGLLSAKSNVEIASFYLNGNQIFSDFQGAITEQYVLQELVQSQEYPIFYWRREKGAAEVDFILQFKSNIIPIEVKSTRNTQSKSLNAYRDIEKPHYAIRLSMKNFGNSDGLISIPLYLMGSFSSVINAI